MAQEVVNAKWLILICIVLCLVTQTTFYQHFLSVLIWLQKLLRLKKKFLNKKKNKYFGICKGDDDDDDDDDDDNNNNNN